MALIGLMLSIGVSATALAANGPSGFSYEGRLYDSSGNPSTATVTLTLGIYNPAGNCLLRSEQSTSLDLSTTNGYFAVTVGQGTATAQDPGLTMTKIFANAGTINGASCAYAPQTGDGRLLRVTINDGVNVTTLSPDVPIVAAPYAVVADTVQGKAPADFIQVNSSSAQLTQAGLESVFASPAAVTELVALATGTSTRYARATASSGIQVPVFAGTPATPIAGQMWYDSGTLKYWNGSAAQTIGVSSGLVSLTVGTGLVDGAGATGTNITSSGTIKMPNVGTAGTYAKVTTDAQGRVTAGAALAEADIPNLTAAGKVSGGAVSGSINVGAGNTVTATYLSSTTDSTQSLRIFEPTNTHKVTLSVPGGLTADWNFILPLTAGTANQVLTTDGAGNLSWTTPAAGGGGVTNVSGTAPISVANNATTPLISIAPATTSTDGYLSSADWNSFNNKLSSSLPSGKILVGNGSNVATAVMPSGDVAVSLAGVFTVGKIQGVTVSGTAPATAGQVLRYDGSSSYVPAQLSTGDISGLTTALGNKIDASQMPANCGANQTLTFSSPTGSWVCSTIAGLTVAQGGTGSADGSITGAGALNFTAGGTNQNITLSPSGTGATIINNGAVGIGTTTPVAPLDVALTIAGGSTDVRAFNASNTGTARYVVGASTVGGAGALSLEAHAPSDTWGSGQNNPQDARAAGGSTIWWSGTSGPPLSIASATGLRFYTGVGVSNPTGAYHRMTIDNAGNVGIGTTAPIVSLDMSLKTDAIALPKGTSAQQPGAPVAGLIRYNTTNNAVEFYNGTVWTTLAAGGAALSTAGGTMTGNLTISSGGLTVTGGVAAFNGGINNNSGGITGAGSISGVGASITGTGALSVMAGGANQNLSLNSSGTGSVSIATGNGLGLQVADGGPSLVNHVVIKGAPISMAPVIMAEGSDANISLALHGKGGGGVVLPTGYLGIGTSAPAQNLHIAGSSSGPLGALAENFSASPGAQAEYRAKNDYGDSMVMGINSSTYSAGGLYSADTGYLVSDAANGLNIGTTFAGSSMIKFFTGGGVPNERLRIDNAGNVGIGTTTPNANLHVVSTSTATATSSSSVLNQVMYAPVSPPAAIKVSGTASNLITSSATPMSNAVLVGSDNSVQIQGSANPSQANGLSATVANYSTGMGASSVAAVSASVINNTSANLQNAYGNLVNLNNSGGGSITNYSGFEVNFQNSGMVTNAWGLYIGTMPGSVTNKYGVFVAEPMAANAFAGSVSVGTTAAPTNRLMVHDTNPTLSPVLVQNQATNGSSSINMRNSSSTLDLRVGVGNTSASSFPGVAHIAVPQSAPLVIGTNNMERVRIDPGGNVGIGTTNPAYLLDVNGQIRVGGPGASPIGGQYKLANIAWSGGSVAGGIVGTQTINISQATVGDSVVCNPRGVLPAYASYHCFVSAAGIVTLAITNNHTSMALSGLGIINWDVLVIK